MLSVNNRSSIKIIEHTGCTEQSKYYHVTVLSNFLLGFDKYNRAYSKERISKSTYPNKFFLLKLSDLGVGIGKASRLLAKLNLPSNRLIVIESVLDKSLVKHNDVTATGLGEYVSQNWIPISNVYYQTNGELIKQRLEDVVADSFTVNGINDTSYRSIMPRSISILPIAHGCQASCAFCFSASSISAEQRQAKLSLSNYKAYLTIAKRKGAQRAVITGGGEPGLLPLDKLLALIRLSKEYFQKVVLISNGYFIANKDNPDKLINQLIESGLSVLSISRHHYRRDINARLMNLDIDSELIAQHFQYMAISPSVLALRWVCVLQKGGIDSETQLANYIEDALRQGVTQICFKELYVSASAESIYFDRASNNWSYENQVPLTLVLDYAAKNNWELVDCLPWGSPVYKLSRGNQSITVAAYTEPSVSWEINNNQCRSWNIMADGSCYASLESKHSLIPLEEPK